MRTLRVLASILVLGAGAYGAGRAITHEDVWLMNQVGGPVPSPDGKWIVFPVSEPSYDDSKQMSDLWIVPADGSDTPRRLTFTRAPENGVQWSPDSKRIAFSTRREGDEANQIYILDIASGGEARRVTNLYTGALAPKWRPDGKAIAFTSIVYPGTKDDEGNKKEAADRRTDQAHVRVYDTFPIRYWDHWLDDRQIHLFVLTLDQGAKPRDILAGTKLVNLAGYSGTETNSGEELVSTWAPDGQSLIFAATENRTEAAYARVIVRLFQVPAGGGEPVQISPSGNSASFSRPAFTPDGKSLFAIREQEGNLPYYASRLARMAWPATGKGSAEWQTVTDSSDLSATSYAFTPDSKSVYFLAENNGLEKAFEVAVGGGAIKEPFATDAGVYTSLAIPRSAASTKLYANWGSAVSPGEVVEIDPSGHRHALTKFNAERVAQLDLAPVKHFWITSSRGKRIHSMLVLPPNFDEAKKYPLLVLIHGGAANMFRDEFGVRWNYHLHASPGYVVLLTNYTGSTGFGEKFAQEIQGDPLKGPGSEINEAADAAIKQFAFIDGSRQAAAGASYGGHLINWMQASTRRYKALVAHAGLINLESQWGTSDGIYHRELEEGGPYWENQQKWQEQNPIRFAKNFHTPILLSVGQYDFRVPMNETLENWSILQRMKVPSKLLVWQDENHWITRGDDSRRFYKEVQEWLAKYL